MRQFEYICGGLSAPEVEQDVRRFRMDVQGDRTVNLCISDISRAMVSNIPSCLLDLLEIAAYVYCGDQRATRGGSKLAEAGRRWHRQMRFVIPVRNADVWSSAELKEELEATLGYLSDDTYQFDFVEAFDPLTEPAAYFPDMSGVAFDPDEVMLFSGGIDSFAGAVENIVQRRRRTLLVGHHSSGKVMAVQKELVSALKQAGYESLLFYVPVNVTNANLEPAEPSQRSRSFLFATLAFVLANMFGKERFTFYENGIVSFNLPIAKDVLGSRATKTTHPKVIRGFERIFTVVAKRPIEISTPYLWDTKKQVIERITSNGFGPMLSRTVSCVHPILWTKDVRHCGRCSQCIDRRFGVLAAEAGSFDPADGYAVDLLTGPRNADEDIRMAVDYVKFSRSILNSTPQHFPAENPDVYSAVNDVPGFSATAVLDRLWEMHRRHAETVDGVLQAGIKEHSQTLARDLLPRGALLRLCFSRSRIEAPPMVDHLQQFAARLDRLAQQVCDFAVDRDAGKIWFRGDYSLEGSDFILVAALLPNHERAKSRGEQVPYRLPGDLAMELKIEEPALRTRIIRLRKMVAERLAIDQGIVFEKDFIENLHGKGYRLAPELRQVTLADLNAADAQVSQTN